MKEYMIFDLDGTLLDSMPLWEGLGERYLEAKGMQAPAELSSRLKNMSLLQFAGYCIRQMGFSGTEEGIVSEIADMVAEKYRTEVPLKEGVFQFLQAEKEKKTKMCVLTASEEGYTRAALSRLQILDCFSFVMTCSQVRLAKDTPEIYLLAAEKLGGRPEQTAVFEDTLMGVQTAKRGGFYVIGVADAAAGADAALIKESCDYYIQSFCGLYAEKHENEKNGEKGIY